MGLFSSKREAAPGPPVRRGQVMKLAALMMAETDAADRDTTSPAFKRAQARLADAAKGSTMAERRAAHEAARRNGY